MDGTLICGFEGSLFDAIKCDIGLHQWEKYYSTSVSGVGGEFGGYYFLPSTLTFYYCPHCFATMQEKTNYKGDFVSRHYDQRLKRKSS